MSTRFLPGLLLAGAALGLGAEWNAHMIAFDKRWMDVFLPDDYREFGALKIPNGTNHNPRVGYGVWTVEDLVERFEADHEPNLDGNATLGTGATEALCVLASYLLPDRMPYFLERRRDS